jgi:aspartyl-tRNA(Asn)/glutamyl-tRNA(Gln) amidotransferase subunit C
MPLDKATVARIATLARIKVPETAQEGLARELDNILTWVEQLNELDTADVAPLANITGHGMTLREDRVTDGERTKDILANAPAASRDFFTVPKVVE